MSLQGLAEYAGLTKLQSRVNHMVSLIITETEADPEKVRFEVMGQYGVDGPEYFVRVLNGGSMNQDPGINWLTPDKVPMYGVHATKMWNVPSILEKGLIAGGPDEYREVGNNLGATIILEECIRMKKMCHEDAMGMATMY